MEGRKEHWALGQLCRQKLEGRHTQGPACPADVLEALLFHQRGPQGDALVMVSVV